jgi:RNA recognition motif-containing protein
VATKLYVGGLAYSVKDEELKDFFATQGNVVSAVVIKDKFNDGRSRGFGFVEMETAEEAKAAIDQLDGKELGGRAIRVNEAREDDDDRRPQQKRGGFGGGGGSSSFRRRSY